MSYLISITKYPKQSVHVSQFYVNHLNHLNVWLVSYEGPLVLELRTLPLSYLELWSGHKVFPPLFVSSWRKFKDYVHYKTIISQNELFEAQVKNFFISWKGYVPFSRYSSFCIFNHLMIYQICEVMMSISTWDRAHSGIYLLNHNSLSHNTWPTDRCEQGQYFSGTFWTIWRTGDKVQVLFNLATCSNYSITSYVKIPVFHFFEKVNKRQLKMVNVNY